MAPDLDAIWVKFRRSLHSLALPAEDQKRLGPGGCLSCELLIDFRSVHEEFRRPFAKMLSLDQEAKLEAVSSAIDALEPADLECFKDEVVDRPAWQRIRDSATAAVRALGCEGETTPDYVEIYLGIWRIPPI